MDDMTITTPHRNLEGYSWLPEERWVASALLTDPVHQVGGKRYCKVCDAWVIPDESDKHARYHRRECAALKKYKATLAARKAREDKAVKAREKKLEKALTHA